MFSINYESSTLYKKLYSHIIIIIIITFKVYDVFEKQLIGQCRYNYLTKSKWSVRLSSIDYLQTDFSILQTICIICSNNILYMLGGIYIWNMKPKQSTDN